MADEKLVEVIRHGDFLKCLGCGNSFVWKDDGIYENICPMCQGVFFNTLEEQCPEDDRIVIKRTGAQINILQQTEEKVVIQVYMQSTNYDWYEFKAKVPKDKIKKL